MMVMKRALAGLLIFLLASRLLLAGPWEAVAQPDLEAHLERAGPLTTEDVCIPFTGLRLRTDCHYLIPNPDGKTFDLLLLSTDDHCLRAQAFDFGSGKVTDDRISAIPPSRPPRAVLGPDGLLYFALTTYKSGLGVYIYDPSKNRVSLMRELGASRPLTRAVLMFAPGDRLLVAGYEAAFSLTRLIEIDTRTGDVSKHGPIGEGAPVVMVRDQAHVYVLTVGSGGRRVHYFSRLTSGTGVVEETFGNPTLRCVEANGITRAEVQDGDRRFLLMMNLAVPILPGGPEPVEPKPASRPELDLLAADPTATSDGTMTVRWRSPGKSKWQSITHVPKLRPGRIKQLFSMSDEHLLCISGRMAIVDPKTGQVTARPAGYLYDRSPRTMLAGRMVSSGGDDIRVHEPTEAEQLNAKPRRLDWSLGNCGLLALVSFVPGPGGRLLFTGRRYANGPADAVGWMDPETLECEACWEPFAADPIVDVAAVPDRDLIAVTTSGKQGRVVFLTMPELAIAGTAIPVKGAVSAGRIVPAGPGRLLGVTRGKDGFVLYGLSAEDLRVAFTKKLSAVPARGLPEFRPGPGGDLFGFLGRVLIRIDPQDARVTVLGTTTPGDPAFADGSLYLAGTPWLRRIELPDRH